MIETILTPEMVERHTRAGEWGARIWPDFIDRTADAAPQRNAIIEAGRSFTYSALRDLIDRLALHFLQAGVDRDDRFAIQLPNWSEFLIARFALAKIGAVAVPLPIDWRISEVRYVLAATEPVGAIVPQAYHNRDYVREMTEALFDLPAVRIRLAARCSAPLAPEFAPLDALLDDPIEQRIGRSALRAVRPNANEVDLIVTTSGSTAKPKLVVRTPNCFIATARQFGEHRGHLNGDDIVAGIAPITRGMGYYVGVAAPVLSGSTMALLERFSPEAALDWLQQTRATVAVAVPTQIVKMLQVPALHRYDLAGLRILVNGGASLAPAMAEEAERRFGCVVLSAYGSVEGATPACTALEDPAEKRYGTVGRVMPGMELRVVDEQGAPVPTGASGEVVYRGPGLSLGYWRDAQTYKDQLTAGGWFASGDLGTLDADGYLTIVGRKKEIIIRGGINISPSEIEDLLQGHRDIAAVAVVKMPDRVLGERCCAFVVPAPGAQVTVSSLAQYLDALGIAKYKFPERVELLDELPMTPDGGKVMRRALEEMIVDRLKAETANQAGNAHAL